MNGSLLPSLLSFVAVVVMIPVALWLVKRTQAVRPGGGGPLAVVTAVTVGPRERIAVVRAGARFLVVGITGQSMALLATLDEWPDQTQLANPASPFATLLERFHGNAQKGS